VSPLIPRPGHRLLRCPICRHELTAAAGALVCRNRHSFDLAREGYVNLLRGRRRRPAAGGDSHEQLRHRAAFLDAGHLDAIVATIVGHVEQASTKPPFGEWCVLDAGSGTGHHLARIATALSPPAVGLGLDISKDATRQAARRWRSLAFAVADLWTEWPVRNAAVDLLISVFAPKNFAEAARVLRPGGWLAVAYPGADHMVELRDHFGLLRRHDDAPRRYSEMVGRFIGSPTIVRLLSRTVLDATTIRAAILMGPNARHIAASTLEAVRKPLAMTFDITVLFARKPDIGSRFDRSRNQGARSGYQRLRPASKDASSEGRQAFIRSTKRVEDVT
jgi:23S rRNA (guanine745-N1)-methyltransferase